MKRVLAVVAVLGLAIGFSSLSALAQSGTIGCGGGNGASVPCNGLGLGSVNSSLTMGSMDVTITSTSGLPSSVASLPLFTPQSVQFDFSFANVGFTYSAGGTFSFTDKADPSLLTVTGNAEYGVTPSPSDISLVLEATNFTFEGQSGTTNSSGSANIELAGDPGVTSMTGSIGLPSGGSPSPTPEPGTLLLLASGLPALAFIRRKLVQA
jgi:hypothetical protein